MDATLQQEIDRLRQLKTKALKTRFREVFGEESPSFNRAHLFRRLAWRLQAQAQGDLSQRARDRAHQLANDLDLRLRAPNRFWTELSKPNGPQATERDPRLPAVGAVLRRTYRGQPVVARVLENGFEYQGKHFDSLSAVAKAATGTRWNGFLFFGLNGEKPNE